jgi:hypothetical protein
LFRVCCKSWFLFLTIDYIVCWHQLIHLLDVSKCKSLVCIVLYDGKIDFFFFSLGIRVGSHTTSETMS